MPKGKKREATPKAPKVSPASVDAPPAPSKPVKSPAEKRAEKAKQREGWSQAEIDAAFAANGGIPKGQTPDPKPTGRPSKYPTIDLERVTLLAAGGLTKLEIAQSIGIAYDTLREYEKGYSEFSEAIEQGRRLEVAKVESALHKNAMGYTHPEEKTFYDSQVGMVVTHQTFKHYPGDTRAQLAILQHAETGSWKPKSDVNHSGEIASKVQIVNLPTKKPVE